ncbi:hypothetical protein AZE42_09409 [Rhizopogon vesiculosus]|uniref:Secreted protein n=1 Tax=Rhizopogon vesiculosus TaxID=180088 RepID=A0A1J8R6V1_9AGAM|nr:hypothetical protein AZE42_09409 [Rhizopogon vesiculosus]
MLPPSIQILLALCSKFLLPLKHAIPLPTSESSSQHYTIFLRTKNTVPRLPSHPPLKCTLLPSKCALTASQHAHTTQMHPAASPQLLTMLPPLKCTLL